MNTFQKKLLVFAISTVGTFSALYARTSLATTVVTTAECDTGTTSTTTTMYCSMNGGSALVGTGLSIVYFDFILRGLATYAIMNNVIRVTPGGTTKVNSTTTSVSGFGNHETSALITSLNTGASTWDYWTAYLEAPNGAQVIGRGIGYVIN